MRNGFLHKKLCIGMALISILSYAQEPTVNIKEEKNLVYLQSRDIKNND